MQKRFFLGKLNILNNDSGNACKTCKNHIYCMQDIITIFEASTTISSLFAIFICLFLLGTDMFLDEESKEFETAERATGEPVRFCSTQFS